MVRDGEPGGGRAAPRWPAVAFSRFVTVAAVAVGVAACAGGESAAGLRAARVVLDRAAAAAVVTQPAFGPGKFWYVRTVQSANAPGFPAFRLTAETWFGFDGTSRTRSASAAPHVLGQDSVTVGDPAYGPGDVVGVSRALFTGAQLASLPTESGRLGAAIDAAEKALGRQENALTIQRRRTAGSRFFQYAARSTLTASQQRSLDMFETAASLLAGPVSPGVRAALYRLIATLPGLRSDGEVRDALGRLGAGVSIGGGRERARITFDPASGELFSDSVGALTQTIINEGFTSSLRTVPSGLPPASGHPPAILLATVSPHVGAAQTVFHVVQSTQNAPIQDTLLGPTAASCKAELFPGPSPQLSGGARTTVAIGALRGLAYRYSFGPASIGRRVWCPGQYQLQVTDINSGEATAYFDVK